MQPAFSQNLNTRGPNRCFWAEKRGPGTDYGPDRPRQQPGHAIALLNAANKHKDSVHKLYMLVNSFFG